MATTPELGDYVTDAISDFHGTLTAITTYHLATPRGQITAGLDSAGKFVEPQWFDMQRIRAATP